MGCALPVLSGEGLLLSPLARPEAAASNLSHAPQSAHKHTEKTRNDTTRKTFIVCSAPGNARNSLYPFAFASTTQILGGARFRNIKHPNRLIA
jgi:hypothetical protein